MWYNSQAMLSELSEIFLKVVTFTISVMIV
jgi:hypothetical protein